MNEVKLDKDFGTDRIQLRRNNITNYAVTIMVYYKKDLG